MRLVNPELLLLMFILPVLAYALMRWQRQPGLAWSNVAGLQTLSQSTPRVRWHRRLPWLRLLAFVLCIVALARPQWGIQATRIDREGIAIAMLVDISSSMGAQDLMIDERRSNRLSVVKDTFKSFVQGDTETLAGREGDLISLYSMMSTWSHCQRRTELRLETA